MDKRLKQTEPQKVLALATQKTDRFGLLMDEMISKFFSEDNQSFCKSFCGS